MQNPHNLSTVTFDHCDNEVTGYATNFEGINSCCTMQAFHTNPYKWNLQQCSICREVWPVRSKTAEFHRSVQTVQECLHCQRDKYIPKKFSKANNMDPGKVPQCLQGLTQVEEMLIARVSPIMLLYRKHGGQRGYKGHILNLSQDIQSLVDKLPQDISNLPIVIPRRVGTNDTYSDFKVHKHKILTALQWLKQHNPFYKSITIDYKMIDTLPEDGVPEKLIHSAENTESDTGQSLPEATLNTQSNDKELESDSDMDWDNNSTCETIETSNHNYTSFIPLPHREHT